MKKEKISVIVSAYNESKLLGRCLDSIIQQTYTNLEIIVINDGSTDGTEQVLAQYAERDLRIIPVYQNNSGLVAVREKGILLASGEYIGFVDGDDSIMPDMYERLIKNAVKYDADISQCGIMYCFEDGRTKAMHGTGKLCVFNCLEGQIALLRGELFEPSLCNKLFVSKLLKESCLDKTIVNNEDLLRNFVLFQRARKTVLEDFCGYLYWRRNNSISNNGQKKEKWRDIIRARELIVNSCSQEANGDARACWLSGIIAAYNDLLTEKDSDSGEMRRYCWKKLKMNQKNFGVLSRREKILAYGIVFFPCGYSVLQEYHQCIKRYQIAKTAANVKREKNEN